ncbi:MAG: bifunctional diaminohydroxyphosphoribosylaminopyrimidine deaminase/5-amino-6-(5-phosphoribosylamino)uracil reductase RibD [Deltaproteobacteria bacterium]|jgi:diaminohydroxyphosphoribosylaminopyrimidine deaminase/5-amino-6-(5-phosphoribosylamino)uracil reductase|nr:bifunctional diaminohydroxyphosphoribosylaminopyrimidine deaminase/5-amino-6-(5-phosphoribosylamino)uracil reductase RibD [Deltaproteobacteria bacterium]
MTRWTDKERYFMREALRLARRGWGLVSPNPLVGAVLAKRGKIVSTGWHTGPGFAHAEAVAIQAAGKAAKGADLYVTLEPCKHSGRTGPCTEAILAAGISKVYYAVPDPNPEASGGARFLEDRGVETSRGLMALEAYELNQFFIKWQMTKKPFVILKTAASLDGKIATCTGDSRWISSKVARNYGHHLRAGVDAILIGRATASKDDPELSARPWGRRKMHREPMRCVLDPSLKLPLNLKLFDPSYGGRTTVFCSPDADRDAEAALAEAGATVLRVPLRAPGRLSLEAVLKSLGGMEVQSVLLEPGATTASSALIDESVADLIHVFIAPMFLGGDGAPGMLGGDGVPLLSDAKALNVLRVSRKGPDIHVICRPKGAFEPPAGFLSLPEDAAPSAAGDADEF